MGIDIAPILESSSKKLHDFSGRTVAVDAHNAVYQFLSSIRQPDGTPLMDRRGRVTSHLSGILYRTTRLLEVDIRPVYVFDGEPHPLKMRTLAGRSMARQRAKEEWRKALEAGDLETARSKAQQTSRLTPEMVEQTIALLTALGVPWLAAPGEGEAMAAHMAAEGKVWAVGSQDYDSLLFGAPRLIRNLTLTGRRKLPRRRAYVTVEPAFVDLGENLERLGLSREQLVDLGILMGTDFNPGIKGIGPKKGLALILKHGDAETALAEEGLEVENLDEVRRIFLRPDVGEAETVSWSSPREEEVVEMLCGEFAFSENRVRRALEKVGVTSAARSQQSLDEWA